MLLATFSATFPSSNSVLLYIITLISCPSLFSVSSLLQRRPDVVPENMELFTADAISTPFMKPTNSRSVVARADASDKCHTIRRTASVLS